MSKLTAHMRDKLPKTEFGLPGERKYPMQNASHARNALARVSQQENAGNISHTAAEKVRAKAHRVLDEKKRGK